MPSVCFPRNTKNGRSLNISDSLTFRRVFIGTLRFVTLLSGLPRVKRAETFAKRRNKAQHERSKTEGLEIVAKV